MRERITGIMRVKIMAFLSVITSNRKSSKSLLIERNNFAANQIYRIMYSSED